MAKKRKSDDEVPEKYALMTGPQQWAWHTEVYAFRQVVLGIDQRERTSPCDPNGEHYNALMVEDAVRRLREKHQLGLLRYHDVHGEELRREGRDYLNQWAREEGFTDIDALVTARYGGERGYGEAAQAYLQSPRYARIVEEQRRLNGAAT